MKSRFPDPGAKVAKLVTVEQAIAQAAAEAKRLAASDRWSRSYVSAKPETPLLVIGPKGGRNYYIVEFRTTGRSTGRMIINGSDGSVGETAGLRTGQDSLPRLALPAELPPLVDQYEVKYAEATIIKLLKEQFSIDSNLVWTACDQSHSPFQPFYVVRQKPYVAYVRVDGRIYPALTTTAAGA